MCVFSNSWMSGLNAVCLAGVLLAGLTIASLGYLLTRYSARKADLARLEADRKKKRMQEEANRAGTADMEVIY